MNLMKKKIAILGSTGSIGRQSLEVIEGHPSLFEVEVLTAKNNSELLIKQAKKFLIIDFNAAKSSFSYYYIIENLNH